MKAYSQDLRERILRCLRPESPPSQDYAALWCLQCYDQTISETTTRGRACAAQSDSWSPAEETDTGGSWCPASITDARRRHIGATLCHVGANAQRTGEPMDHESGDQTAGLDAKKKSLGATERNEEERTAWQANASKLPTEDLVFIDETGSNIALTPLYARAPRGERARGSVPRNRGKNTTLIAALSLEGMGAALILEGSANTTAFELYIEQVLAPSLHAGQIVVMDNLQAHKSARVQQAIEAKGCQRLFLPGYSPDLSPIEEAFSKLKTALRRAGARTREALEAVISQALLTITAQDAQGWFQHCGYVLTHERKS
ncbi:MAG TPA: IS630 family transposase [Ktedonobacteraceae bacterium]